MKTLNEYLATPYKIEIIEDNEEGGYIANFPELPGCITYGSTIEETIENAKDAKKEWLIAALEENIKIPESLNTQDYFWEFMIRIPKSLHQSLAEHAKQKGISLNQYCIYLLSQNDTIHAKLSH